MASGEPGERAGDMLLLYEKSSGRLLARTVGWVVDHVWKSSKPTFFTDELETPHNSPQLPTTQIRGLRDEFSHPDELQLALPKCFSFLK